MIAAAVFFACAAASWLLVLAVRRWAERNAILDHPNERSSHERPTPRGGGVAIVVVTLSVVLGFAVLRGGDVRHQAFWLAGLSLSVAAISFIDDLRGVPAAIRFAVHLAAAAAALIVFGGIRTLALPGIGDVALGAAGGVVTVLWIIGLTNAYNFMDGIDGIAGGQAFVAGAAWYMLAVITHQPLFAAAGVAIAGSAAGFLIHNWQPARVFMGDVGAAFLGYVFAAMSVAGAAGDRRLALCGVLVVWPFIFDTAITFLRRAVRRERIFSAHRSHLYQRLNQIGISHARIAALYVALSALGAAGAIAIARRVAGATAVTLSAIAVTAAGLWCWTVLRERARRPVSAS